MIILGCHTEHSGGVAILEDGQLRMSIEAEKDSNPRYATLPRGKLLKIFDELEAPPDALALGGWWNKPGGYLGYSQGTAQLRESEFLGFRLHQLVTPHERTHIMTSYGMSPMVQGTPCYCLVWEGTIGSFYEIDSDLRIQRIVSPLSNPGHRYAFLYELAHPDFDDASCGYSMNVAGKLMALAASSSRTETGTQERELIETLLGPFDPATWTKSQFRQSRYYNIGTDDPQFSELAGKFSDALFGRFYQEARKFVRGESRPLLIAGGCGLNCEWNTKWRDSGLFSEVFVPPCTDDSGAAIGAAIDAQFHLNGRAKISWSVYAGEEFVHDSDVPPTFRRIEPDLHVLAQMIADGSIMAWVEGRYEIGPRALGHRSIIAAPFSDAVRDRLNEIKRREHYRPVAPVCSESDAPRYFDSQAASPHMLYFQGVVDDQLKAVTHVDGSARMQTLRAEDAPHLFALLTTFGMEAGIGVLCNTSLNFPGRGFVNRTSDLVALVVGRELDGFVIDGEVYVRS